MVMMWLPLLLLMPCFLASAEFDASVNRNELGINENFVLNLTLKDASAKNSPDIEPLRQTFHIISQQQSSNTVITAGKISSNFTWSFTLLPQSSGQIQIPSISINTSEGTLSTQPITIDISQEKNPSHTQTKKEIRVEAETNNLTPYKNESFFLTVRLTSQRPLTNVQVEKFEIEEAIMEPFGDPIVKEKIENGTRVVTVDFKYLITPLKPGILKIPSIIVQGNAQQKKGSSTSFDSFDPFALMQGFVSWQPFALTTEALPIDIRPPIASLTPWLPAQSLAIQENWENIQTFRVGEVINRSFTIAAEGIHSSQLPTLKDQQNDRQFKVYADKPELKDEFINGKLKSSRIEHYTLIPRESGELILPEISIAWWNTEKEEKNITSLAKRQLHALPSIISPENIEKNTVPFPDEQSTQTEDPALKNISLIYTLIGILLVLLLCMFIVLVLLQKKINRLQKKSLTKELPSKRKKSLSIFANKPFLKNKRETLDDLNPT